jgi:fatty acid desaturase
MQRSDTPAIRYADPAGLDGALRRHGSLSVAEPVVGSLLPRYGVLYGSATDSRWHECGHGTAFRTRWMNDAVSQIASFMIMRNPVTWHWSHTRHHTETIIVGRDPEIVFMRPPDLLRIFLNFFGLVDACHAMKTMAMNTFGVMSEEEKTYAPEGEQPRAIRIACIWFAIYAATIALALYTGSILPLKLVGLPRLYGAWHHVMTGLLQHGGLAENVIDHRLNSRTVYMNPVSRFTYWNMNYLSVAADQRPALGGGDGHHQHGGRHQPQARPLSRRDLNRAWQARREGGPEGGEEKSKSGDPEGP